MTLPAAGTRPRGCEEYPRLGRAAKGSDRFCNAKQRTPDATVASHSVAAARASLQVASGAESWAGAAEQGEQEEQEEESKHERMSKGPISKLQEFAQCAKEFRLPPKKPILQWSYESRMADFSVLEFRATATFLLVGVPHHSAGAWYASKKVAQREAAEAALHFFLGRWGGALLAFLESGGAVARPDGVGSGGHCHYEATPAVEEWPFGADAVGALNRLCAYMSAYGEPVWQLTRGDDWVQALVEIDIFNVPHKFRGQACTQEAEAYTQTARRVLWYLQCPGYEDSFEPHPGDTCAALLAPPPERWAVADPAEEEALQEAERKTSVMRVQNRLQQMLAQRLQPGQSVWEWSFEPDRDGEWPPLYRATVNVRELGVEFTGEWHRGHRNAQHSVCDQVSHYLDGLVEHSVST